MITNYFSLNQELLDELHSKLGDILVVTKSRTDAVNFYNELLLSYKNNTGSVICSKSELEVSCKAHRITIRAVKNKEDLNGLKGRRFTKIYAVGFYNDSDFEFLTTWLK